MLLTKDYNPTAALFPRLVALSSLVLIVLDLSLRLFTDETAMAAEKEEKKSDSVSWYAALALQGGYIAFIYLIGFSAATLLFLLLCPWHLRYRRWPITVIHGALLTLVIVGSFHLFFHVRLPKGFLGIPW